jgi:CHAT domain-containing protein
MPLLRELGDESGRATVLINLASAAEGTRPDDPRIDEVLAIADRLGDENLKATALKLRGGRQYAGGDLAAANATLESAAAAYVRSHDVAGAAASYLMIGRIHRAHNDFEGALGCYQRAIDMLAPTRERYTLVEAVNASAVALGLMGKQSEAIAAYERGLALARESGNVRLIDFMLGNLGGGLLSAGQDARAILALQEVLSRNPEPYIAAFRHNQLAIALVHVGRVADAIAPIDESIRITRELKQVEMLDSRLDDQAWILGELGRYEDALASSREALALVEQARAQLLPTDFLKRGYGDRVQTYYARGVDLLSRLGHAEDALELSEQGRSRAFLDLLAARETGQAELATRGETVSPASERGDAAALESNAMGRPSSTAEMVETARRLDSAIVTFWVDKDVTLAWVVTPDGRVRDTRLAVGRDRLASLVSATTAPLRNSAESAVASRGLTDDIAALPLRGLGLLALSRDDRSAWRELDRLLVDPLRPSLPARGSRVIVVPHGPLLELAFAALQSATGRYLIEDFEVGVAPSISVLAFTGRRQEAERRAPPGPWMLVGNPAALPAINGHALAPLPGAAQEIAAIAGLAPHGAVVRLDAADADESALAGALDASHPSVVHFATHGFVPADPKAPPFLVLNHRGDAAAQDGRLTMDEIYDLRLSSDLVVLSACRSGSGAISSDGVIGLARAFFYAGSPSVMATLWDVPDATTALLMPRFYRGYVATREKSASLRAAQLALLADLRAGRVAVTASGTRVVLPEHPLLWAGFVMVGEPGNGPKPSKGAQ